MSNDEGRYFLYPGTVETLFELKVLADYCGQLPLWPRTEIIQQYRRSFSELQNFTFVADSHYGKQMAWGQSMEDDAGVFQIYASDDEQNPYPRCKTSRIHTDERRYHIYVYYRDLAGSVNFP